MRIVWSRRAAAHLVAIREHIEHDNPEAAEGVARRIRDAVRQLVRQPLMGRPGGFEALASLWLPAHPT